jgi:hypothetical protein
MGIEHQGSHVIVMLLIWAQVVSSFVYYIIVYGLQRRKITSYFALY